MKLETLRCTNTGEETSTLKHAYNLGESTLHNIKKKAEKIQCALIQSPPLSAKETTRIRNSLTKRMEKVLLLYIKHKMKKNSSLGNLQHRSKV